MVLKAFEIAFSLSQSQSCRILVFEDLDYLPNWVFFGIFNFHLGCQRTTLMGMEWMVQRNIEWQFFWNSARTYQTVSASHEFWIKLCSFWNFYGHFYIPMPHRSKISSAHHGLITEWDKVNKHTTLKAF